MQVRVELTLEGSDTVAKNLSLSFLGQSRVAHRRLSVFGNNFASRLLFLFVTLLNVYLMVFVTDCYTIPTFSTFSEYEKCVYGV